MPPFVSRLTLTTLASGVKWLYEVSSVDFSSDTPTDVAIDIAVRHGPQERRARLHPRRRDGIGQDDSSYHAHLDAAQYVSVCGDLKLVQLTRYLPPEQNPYWGAGTGVVERVAIVCPVTLVKVSSH